MGLAKCHFWLKTEKNYYCFLARAAEGEGMVTFALASAVISIVCVTCNNVIAINRLPYKTVFNSLLVATAKVAKYSCARKSGLAPTSSL